MNKLPKKCTKPGLNETFKNHFVVLNNLSKGVMAISDFLSAGK